MLPLKRILLATDFSDPARYAQQYAAELVDMCQAELHLLHVIAPLPVPTMGTPEFGYCTTPPSVMVEIEESSRQVLGNLFDDAWQSRHRIVKSVRVGTTVSIIIDYAKEHQIDLIVVGTVGRTGLSHLLLGSVAESVVRKAHCPVLTVRPPSPRDDPFV